MISETIIFFCGLFAAVLVAGFFTLSGLELRRLGEQAERRRRDERQLGSAKPETSR